MGYPVLYFGAFARGAPAMQRFSNDVVGWRIGPPANDCAMAFPNSSMEQQ